MFTSDTFSINPARPDLLATGSRSAVVVRNQALGRPVEVSPGDVGLRAKRLLDAAQAGLARGDRRLAVRMALRSEKIVDGEQRVILALVLAEAGLLSKAREVAWSIENPDARREVVAALSPEWPA